MASLMILKTIDNITVHYSVYQLRTINKKLLLSKDEDGKLYNNTIF